MSENTHVATAKFRQEGVHEWQSQEGSTDATNIAAALDAQIEATLALAHEQRTANLLGLHGALRDRNEHRKAFGVLEVITERLGL